MKKFALATLAILTLTAAQAQRFTALNNLEFRLGIGTSNTLSELGGANREGTHFIRDYEIAMTRPSFMIGARYFVPETRFAGTFNLSYLRVAGRDNLTKDIYRENRNLNFRSGIFEISTTVEFYFVKRREGSVYNLREVVGQKKQNMDFYLFGGVGLFFFNPKGQYNGEWYALQPLNTEGQGLVPTRTPYRRTALSTPFGLGARYGINQQWLVGAEFNLRYTSTDYLDDVSTTYVDNDIIAGANGAVAGNLADPSLGTVNGQTTAGEQRGDPRYNDFFMSFTVNVSYKIGGNARGRGRLPKFFSWAARF